MSIQQSGQPSKDSDKDQQSGQPTTTSGQPTLPATSGASLHLTQPGQRSPLALLL